MQKTIDVFKATNFDDSEQKNEKKRESKMFKHQSQPKFRTMKQEILRIPKVKQMLNKDRYVFSQDIQKRVELIGSLKDQNFHAGELSNLHEIRKAKQDKKKNKRHKTNFKIPLTRNNINSMNQLLKGHIDKNQKYKNEEVVFLKQYMENAPFNLQKLKFMDELNPIKKKYHDKFPDYKEGVLKRNRLLLEHVILNRNIKREMKLDRKKEEKIHAKNVMDKL